MDERIDNVKALLFKKIQEKTNYDWLGKQVVFEINALKSETLKKDTSWKIQTVLREASLQDEKNSSIPPRQPSNSSSLSESQSSSNSSTQIASSRIQFFTSMSPSCSYTNLSSPSPSYSSKNNSVYRPQSSDILQKSLVGILDEEDF